MYFRRQKLISVIVVMVAICGFSNSSFAESGGKVERYLQGVHLQIAQLTTEAKQKKTINKATAAKIAQKRHGGKVLSVETKKSKSGIQYRVKILLDNGRIRTVTIKG